MSQRFRTCAVLALILAVTTPCLAQYTDWAAFQELGGPQEFARRRAHLCQQLKGGYAVLFARNEFQEANHYREDNDFYYFTGLAEPGAILLLEAAKCEMTLFSPVQPPRAAQVLGPNLLSLTKEQWARLGVSKVMPVSSFDFMLTSAMGESQGELWLRLGHADRADNSRSDVAREVAGLQYGHPYPHTPGYLQTIKKMQERYPAASIRDLTPVVDAMRDIKTPAEMAVLRRNGKLSAAGQRRAIARAKPGMYQYQVEAEAAYVFRMQGAQGWGYPAIVGSGENVNTWHYFSNRSRIEPDELVVFDFGADLNQLTIDITRTFNVSGKFTPEQAKWYQVDLEAQKAVIAALKPGNTYEQAGAEGKKIFEKHGIGHMWFGTIAGHSVGMAVHDVSRLSGPIKAGQVVTVEPIIEFPEKRIHIRVEDTVLITENGPEVLSADVPKEMAEIEKLVGSEAGK